MKERKAFSSKTFIKALFHQILEDFDVLRSYWNPKTPKVRLFRDIRSENPTRHEGMEYGPVKPHQPPPSTHHPALTQDAVVQLTKTQKNITLHKKG